MTPRLVCTHTTQRWVTKRKALQTGSSAALFLLTFAQLCSWWCYLVLMIKFYLNEKYPLYSHRLVKGTINGVNRLPFSTFLMADKEMRLSGTTPWHNAAASRLAVGARHAGITRGRPCEVGLSGPPGLSPLPRGPVSQVPHQSLVTPPQPCTSSDTLGTQPASWTCLIRGLHPGSRNVECHGVLILHLGGYSSVEK